MTTDAKLTAEWFEVDRWNTAEASGLPLEARGLYREMLSQAWVRGASLPADLEAVQLACKVRADEWGRAWPIVAVYWRQDGDRLVNDVQRGIYAEAQRRYRAASARAQAGAAARWHKAEAKKPEAAAAGPSWRFSNLYVSPKMHAFIAGQVGKAAARVDWEALYRTAAADYAERGVPANKLDDLQARARSAASRVREFAERQQQRALEAPSAPMSPEERAAAAASLRANLRVRV